MLILSGMLWGLALGLLSFLIFSCVGAIMAAANKLAKLTPQYSAKMFNSQVLQDLEAT